MTLTLHKVLKYLVSSQDESVKKAANLSKNFSRDPATQTLVARSVGGFTLNFYRNPLCASFSLPPILHSAAPSMRGVRSKGPAKIGLVRCQIIWDALGIFGLEALADL